MRFGRTAITAALIVGTLSLTGCYNDRPGHWGHHRDRDRHHGRHDRNHHDRGHHDRGHHRHHGDRDHDWRR